MALGKKAIYVRLGIPVFVAVAGVADKTSILDNNV